MLGNMGIIGGKMVCHLFKKVIMDLWREYLANQVEGKGRMNAISPRMSEPL